MTLDVSNRGTLVREEQPSSMECIFVTWDVSSSGMLVIGVPANADSIFVTLDVSNSGTLVRARQPWNILVILVTLDVSNSVTLVRDVQFLNKLFIEVMPTELKPTTSSKSVCPCRT